MAERTIVITGATSGLGREIATQLAGHGAVLVGVRNVDAGNAMADEISKNPAAKRPKILQVDMSRPRSVRAFADAVRAEARTVDVLVNCAGVQSPVRRVTEDGIEETFATNVLGYFLLMRELLESLKAAPAGRIVNVASSFAGELDLDDLEFTRRPYDGIKAYKQSKAADRLLTWAAAQRLAGTKVTANAMNPGLVWTGLYRNVTGMTRLMVRLMSRIFGRTVAQGADTAAWLATSDEVAGKTSALWEQRQEKTCEFRDPAKQDQLWQICTGYVDRVLGAPAAR